MNKRLIGLLREEFTERVNRKTGWGKNEILQEFEQAISNTIARLLDEQEKEEM